MRTLPWFARPSFRRFGPPLLVVLALLAVSPAWSASVTIDQGAAQLDPVDTQPVVFDVVFSLPVTGFTSADIDLSASTAPGILVAAVSGAGTNYTVTVSGATGPGVIVATIPAGVTVDSLSAPNSASTSSDTAVSLVRPTVTINQAAGQSDPTAAQPVLFDVVFSTAVTGFTGADVNLSASTAPGALSAVVSGAGTNYTVSVSGLAGPGTVVASIPTDATDGIGNQASTSTDNSVQANITPAAATAVPAMSLPALLTLGILLLLAGTAVIRR